MIATGEELIAHLERADPDRPAEPEVLQPLLVLHQGARESEFKEQLRVELNSMTAWLGDGSWIATVYGIQGTHLPEDLPYLDARLAATANTYLKVGYTYASWQLDRRPERARAAVDAALAFLSVTMERVHAGVVPRSAYLQPLLDSGLLMSGRCGNEYRRGELISAVKQIACDTEVSLDVRRHMIAVALTRRGDFAVTDLVELLPAADVILSQSHRGGASFIAESARIGRRLAIRSGIPDEDGWQRREADAYVALMQSNPQATLYEAAATRAIALLRQLGDDQGRTEVERRYDEAISQQTLHQLGAETNIGEYIDHERRKIRTLLDEHGGMGIVAYLAIRPSLLPRRSDVEQSAESILRDTVSIQLTQRSKRAPDGRVVAHSSIGEENEHALFVDQFRLFLSIYSRAAMAAFSEGVSSGQLSRETLVTFLSQTWIGIPEGFAQQQDQPVQYDLVSRLVPALTRLLAVYDGEPADDLILVIDSLTPALELLLRTLCRRLGLPTIVARPDSAGRPVDEVESLGVYLRRLQIRRVLGEDLATALDVILVEPFGYGIRDDVAHALLFPQQYSLEIATLLGVAVIRLAAIPNHRIQEEMAAHELGNT